MELSKFQVVFYDNNQNELWSWTEEFSYDDAEAYAKEIIATTSYDVSSFLINKI